MKGEQKSNPGQSKQQQKDELCAEAEPPSTEEPGADTRQDELSVKGNDKNGADKAKELKHERLNLHQENTSYVYDGLSLNVLKEYKGTSSPKATARVGTSL